MGIGKNLRLPVSFETMLDGSPFFFFFSRRLSNFIFLLLTSAVSEMPPNVWGILRQVAHVSTPYSVGYAV